MLSAPTRRLVAASLVLLAVGGADADDIGAVAEVETRADSDELTAVVHRTETCGCCGAYEDVLEARGFEVVQEIHPDLAPVKAELGVPPSEQSCHTSVIDGYVVEGHVPMLAIRQLLDQRPDIDGIALGGMPSGSPGMPGQQTEPFVVTTLVDGEVTGEFGSY
jgi:hypothetical protein